MYAHTSESRPATGVSPLASATRWGSTPQRVCRGSNHRDLSLILGVASVHPLLLESLSGPYGGIDSIARYFSFLEFYVPEDETGTKLTALTSS